MTWEGTASALDVDSLRVNFLCGKKGEMESMKGKWHEQWQGRASAGLSGSGK